MPTISENLAQLQQDREDLVDNLETMGITGLSGDETFTELVPEVLNISGGGGADLSDYLNLQNTLGSPTYDNSSTLLPLLIKTLPDNISIIGNNFSYLFNHCSNLISIPQIDTSSVTNMTCMFHQCNKLTNVPQLNTSNVTNMYQMFRECKSLVTAPALDTSNVTNMGQMFVQCQELVNVPQYDASKVTSFSSMFGNIFGQPAMTKLTNNSINNILGMCASATSYTGTKTLYYLFGNSDMSSYYPASTIQGLSNYQDFIDAGWTIGW